MWKVIGNVIKGGFGSGVLPILLIVGIILGFSLYISHLRTSKIQLEKSVKALEIDKKALTQQLKDLDATWHAKAKALQKTINDQSKRIKTDSTEYLSRERQFQTLIKTIVQEKKDVQIQLDTCASQLQQASSGLLCRERNFWGKLTGKLVPCQ